jgi:RNA polymerase sigma factor (sigma-70 family)
VSGGGGLQPPMRMTKAGAGKSALRSGQRGGRDFLCDFGDGGCYQSNTAMNDDTQLLHRYAETRSEDAFAELVRRHVNLVHSAALRQVNGDAYLAQDVTQLVFTDLARKAATVAEYRVLAGWLFTSTRYAAAKLVRGEQRRRTREAEAHLMNELNGDQAETMDWDRVRPVLDETLAESSEADREAILLRFFEGRDFAEVGARLRLSENAARMRVECALEKLHALLARRGMTSTTAALAVALGGQAVMAAPAGLAATVTGAALAGGGTVAAGAAAGGLWATFMSMTKLQVGISSALVVAGATGLVIQTRSNAALRDEVAGLRQQSSQVESLRTENLRLARQAAEVAEMRADDAALARVQQDAAALGARAKTVAQAAARAGANEPTLDASKLDRQPTPRFQARPRYPVELREAGIAGEVVVDFLVDGNGDVRDAKVWEKSDGQGAAVKLTNFTVAGAGKPQSTVDPKMAEAQLGAAAVEAVSQWKFDAGRKGGRAVNTRLQIPIVFTLNEAGPNGAAAPKP